MPRYNVTNDALPIALGVWNFPTLTSKKYRCSNIKNEKMKNFRFWEEDPKVNTWYFVNGSNILLIDLIPIYSYYTQNFKKLLI